MKKKKKAVAALILVGGAGGAAVYDEAAATLSMPGAVVWLSGRSVDDVGVGLTQAAYCPAASNWTCATCDSEARPTAVVEETATDSKGRAIVGVDRRDSTVFVSYRGTENINNWIRDADFVKTCPYADGAICVEAGFWRWYLALGEAGVTEAIYAAARATGYTRLKTMGHSAGGAIATLLAYDVRRGNYTGLALAQIHTFGSPRVGDRPFAEAFNATIRDDGMPSFRLTHYRDIVPQLPPETLEYHHVPTEVFYDELFTNFTVCDGSGEDAACSDSCYLTFLCDRIEDHMTYLNISVGIAGC